MKIRQNSFDVNGGVIGISGILMSIIGTLATPAAALLGSHIKKLECALVRCIYDIWSGCPSSRIGQNRPYTGQFCRGNQPG